MKNSLSDYDLGNDFVARDVLSSLHSKHPSSYVIMALSGVEGVAEGTLLEVKGGTALLKVGNSLQFVDLDRVVTVMVQKMV